MQAFEKLEQEWGKWAQVSNVVACSSGTSALHLALEAFRFPLGSEVIVPEFTMIACARAVTLAGLVPVFVDCGDDLLINPDLIEEKITNKTVAIMPVHVYGRRCNMEAISEFTYHPYGLEVFEDLAEGHGIPKHKCSSAACWSFYQNKIVAGEEGGAIAFRYSAYADYARELRSVGFTKDHNFLHHPRGFNARLSNANSELILKSLRVANQNIWKRKEVESWYMSLDDWQTGGWRDAVWVYDVRIPNVDIEAVVRKCNEQGVAARCGFKPMSMQPEYREDFWEHLNAYRLSQEILYLPVYPDMTQEDCERNVTVLRQAVNP